MNEAARKIWKSPAGHSLFAAIFERRPLTPQQQTADQLKRVDPPKLANQLPRQPT